MNDTLVEFEELKKRLDIELTELETQAATNALADLSDLARYYGQTQWTAQTVPPVVKVTILNAARRFMKLIDGVTLSRAGDETLQWTDLRDKTGTLFFTEPEQAHIRQAAGLAGDVYSVGVFAYNSHDQTQARSWPALMGGPPAYTHIPSNHTVPAGRLSWRQPW